jgi:hypothetical protein
VRNREPTKRAALDGGRCFEAKQTGVVQRAIDARNLKGVNVVTK